MNDRDDATRAETVGSLLRDGFIKADHHRMHREVAAGTLLVGELDRRHRSLVGSDHRRAGTRGPV